MHTSLHTRTVSLFALVACVALFAGGSARAGSAGRAAGLHGAPLVTGEWGALPPAAVMAATTSARASALRATATTCRPSRASRRAMALPMPRLAPVTMATRRSMAGSFPLGAGSARLECIGHEPPRRVRPASLYSAPRHSAVAGGTPLTEAEIEAKVINIIADKIKVEKAEIKRETNFMTDLNADSLDMVELLMAFEEEFGTKIPEGDSEKLQTVGLAIDYIKQRKAAGN
jgi:acyl carrier protein